MAGIADVSTTFNGLYQTGKLAGTYNQDILLNEMCSSL